MKRRTFLQTVAAGAATAMAVPAMKAQAAAPQAVPFDGHYHYHLGPDSKPQPGVPRGKIFNLNLDFSKSKIFHGEQREITAYVPAQYRPDQPARVFITLDEIWLRLPIVLDNLIHQGKLPVIIVIGFVWGWTPSARAPQNKRFDRSFEFDSRTSSLADFMIEELLPKVQQQKTPDGLPIVLSDNPDDRGVGGLSSGGIGAFTVAWQRPDAFRRVFSVCGTFVGMRGGDHYPVLIRKTEPKPLRLFLNDGSQDGWVGGLEFGD
ncbi:MAG: alpha/beta hydrolase [Phycisphaerae bacterium]